ncbi:MAG: N,N-dimethylformamidase beta subunit family domain-containing protein [Janthinobacterium lividum]
MPASNSDLPAVIGYVSPLSARAGQQLEFKISSTEGREISATVLRLDCCDPNPAGPGTKSVAVDFGLMSRYPATQQRSYLGSCLFGSVPAISETPDLKVTLRIKPTFFGNADQTIFALQHKGGSKGLALIHRQGALFARRLGQVSIDEALDLALTLDQWTDLDVVVGLRGVTVSTSNVANGEIHQGYAAQMGLRDDLRSADHICFAATWMGHPVNAFNGLIEAPCLSSTVPSEQPSEPQTLARWDFATGATNQWVEDVIDRSRHLTLVNAPMRAVRSSSWSGRNMHFKHAPHEYAAIAFHSDDLDDCQWETTIAMTVPADVPSGVYGLKVDNELGSDTIPFYVLAGDTLPRKRIVFLAPTFTYMAYANHARGNFAGPLEARVREWGAYANNPDAIGAFGYSTYNRHPDGSGVTLSSRLRPMMTMRPGYLVYHDENGSGMRGFSADSHLTSWLMTKGFEFDVLTDEDLDREGVDALSPYDVVLTGSQPEYHTRSTLEALIAYRGKGGKLMYMGGNGFYWKIGRDAAQPHLIEVRRAEGGMRVWASQPGEYYHQLDGEYGGLWRRNGITPQRVAGVGFTAEGAFEGTYYVRTKESFRTELAFLFDGIPADQRIGDFGLSGGGAAGFEIDQACPGLGTEDFVTVIAASEGHGPTFVHTYEELLLPDVFDGGPRPYGGMRANIVYGLAGNGGGLFSVGSITFCGSLSHENYTNNVSRLVENCLRKFLDLSSGQQAT